LIWEIAFSKARFEALFSMNSTAIIQPGGSIRDPEIIQAADEHVIAMVFSGARHFRH